MAISILWDPLAPRIHADPRSQLAKLFPLLRPKIGRKSWLLE
jgi:hypothetical protein